MNTTALHKINGLIPHRPPMLLVDELICLENGQAASRTVFPLNSPFVNQEGLVEEAALFEMMAQTFAAGVAAGNEGPGPSAGYLAGVKRLVFSGRARAGEPVEVKVKIVSVIDDFYVVEGRASQEGESLASGQITVYVPEEGPK